MQLLPRRLSQLLLSGGAQHRVAFADPTRCCAPPLIMALIAMMFLLSGCGYQMEGKYSTTPNSGYKWQSLYRQDVSTVAVPIFKNNTYSRGMEFGLTTAIIEQIESRTPYKVVDRSVADTILEGEITNVHVNPTSYNQFTVTPQEQLMTVTVNFTWKEIRTGRILCQRRAFDQSVAYYPMLAESDEVGSLDAVDRLALGIVRELQADW